MDADFETLLLEKLRKQGSDSLGDVSVSSDVSLDFPLNFKQSVWSPAHSKLRKQGSDSPGNVSMSSDASLDFPLSFKQSEWSPAHSDDESGFSRFHLEISRLKGLSINPLDTDAAEEPELKRRRAESETDTPGFTYRQATCISDLLTMHSPSRPLQLLWNDPGDLGVKRLSAVLENSRCTLDTLRLVLKNTAEAVIITLKDSVSSLSEVYGALITADVDPITGQCFNSDYIRQQIVQAHQHLEQSEQTASSGLKSLDENLERLTEDEGKLEQEKSSTETHLENLRTEQASNEKLHRDSQGALEQARRNFNSTQQTLQDQKQRKHNGIITGVGAGLMVIPVIGWLAGISTMVSGGVGINQSKRAVQAAKEEVKKAGDEVTKYETKVSENESRISHIRDNMRQKECKLEQMCERIQRVRKQREMVAEFQEKMRRAMHLLGLLSKESSMAEHQTRRFVLQEPVRKVMEDVMRVTELITLNDLVNDDASMRWI